MVGCSTAAAELVECLRQIDAATLTAAFYDFFVSTLGRTCDVLCVYVCVGGRGWQSAHKRSLFYCARTASAPAKWLNMFMLSIYAHMHATWWWRLGVGHRSDDSVPAGR